MVPRNSHLGVMTLTGGATLAVALLVMLVTNPLTIGPLGVTTWFLLILIAISSFASIAAFFVGKRFESHATEGQLLRSARRRGIMVGIYVSVLLALSSLQQFNLRDAILLLILLVLTEFYLVAKA